MQLFLYRLWKKITLDKLIKNKQSTKTTTFTV